MKQDDTPKISQNRQKKEAIVAEFSDKVARAKAFVFTNYQGITHRQLEGLKRAAKKTGAEYVVTKNSLLLRALETINLTDDDKKHFEQPTATLFIYEDVIEPLKELAKTVKALSIPAVKFGIFPAKGGTNSGRDVISADNVLRLSTLPPLPTLRAQLLGQMLSPVQGLHRALRWNLQNLVLTLKAIETKKQ